MESTKAQAVPASMMAFLAEADAVQLATVLGVVVGRLLGHRLVTGATASSGKLLTVAQAAEMTGLSARYFYDHKTAPYMRRLGRAYRVDEDELREQLEGGARGPSAPTRPTRQTSDFWSRPHA